LCLSISHFDVTPARQQIHERGLIRPAAGRKIAFCLLMLFLLSTTACGEKAVATVSTEAEAIEIIDVLRESGFEDLEKHEVGEGEQRRWAVELDEGLFGGAESELAFQRLRDYGLPRQEQAPIADGGFITSEAVQKAQEQRRIRADIERQLRALPGVTVALVTVVMPQDPTLELNPYPASASVVVVHKEQSAPFNEQQIQNLVAKGVPKLKPEDVSVTISQQQPRPIPRREFGARRRANLLIAGAAALVLILGSLLVVLLLQMRRQRARLAELSAHGAEEEAMLADGDSESLEDETAGGELVAGAARSRELPS
jgi:type III secretory pathway lipoprotein EscJ